MNNRNILFFLLLFISFNIFAKIGGNKDYNIITQEEYDARISKDKDIILKRQIIVPAFDKNYEDIIGTKNEEALLAKFSFLLKKANIAWMDKYVKYCDSMLEINDLIKGLYYFSKKEYGKAIQSLSSYNGTEHHFLKLLLIADSHYELGKKNKNLPVLIGHYQLAMDQTDNFQKKELIKNRIKYIKYN